ncbi:MAG: hypothetical protein PVI30_12465 [Myxococcales bacterium]|jgi:hypothetical protein
MNPPEIDGVASRRRGAIRAATERTAELTAPRVKRIVASMRELAHWLLLATQITWCACSTDGGVTTESDAQGPAQAQDADFAEAPDTADATGTATDAGVAGSGASESGAADSGPAPADDAGAGTTATATGSAGAAANEARLQRCVYVGDPACPNPPPADYAQRCPETLPQRGASCEPTRIYCYYCEEGTEQVRFSALCGRDGWILGAPNGPTCMP